MIRVKGYGPGSRRELAKCYSTPSKAPGVVGHTISIKFAQRITSVNQKINPCADNRIESNNIRLEIITFKSRYHETDISNRPDTYIFRL